MKKDLKIEGGKMNYLQRAQGHRNINDAKYRTLAYLENLE